MAGSSLRDLKQYVGSLYVPAFAASIAQGLVLSVLPLYLKSTLGADAATVGAIVGIHGIGSPCAAIPAGLMADHFGTRLSMLLGAGVRLLSYVMCTAVAFAALSYSPPADPAGEADVGSGSSNPSDEVGLGSGTIEGVDDTSWAIGWLAAARILTGLGLGTFQVARSSWMKESVPQSLRGRANSFIGGSARIANVIGPALGGAIMTASGGHMVFLTQTLLGIGVVGLLSMLVPRPPTSSAPAELQESREQGVQWTATSAANPEQQPPTALQQQQQRRAQDAARLQSTFFVGEETSAAAGNRRVGGCPPWARTLLAVAPVGFAFVLARAVRQLLIPLKADALALGANGAGYVTAASFAFDSAAFPLSGVLMDRYGRRAAGVPALGLMALGLAFLGGAHGVAPLLLAAALLGVGNGLSAGFVLTIGQDAAPAVGKSTFIGVFKVCTDSALFLGPLSVGLLTRSFSLDASCWVMSGVVLSSAVWYARGGATAGGSVGHGVGGGGGSGGAGPPGRHQAGARKHQRLEEDEDDTTGGGRV